MSCPPSWTHPHDPGALLRGRATQVALWSDSWGSNSQDGLAGSPKALHRPPRALLPGVLGVLAHWRPGA